MKVVGENRIFKKFHDMKNRRLERCCYGEVFRNGVIFCLQLTLIKGFIFKKQWGGGVCVCVEREKANVARS